MEKEKRLSRPTSGQYSRPNSLSITIRGAGSSGTSSNRDSIGKFLNCRENLLHCTVANINIVFTLFL